MRRRRFIIVLAACVLAGSGVIALWPGPKEPEYNGKKLSEWLEIYEGRTFEGFSQRSEAQNSEAENAIRAIGTNGFPCLLKWARYEMRPWEIKLAYQCKRFRLGYQGWERKAHRASCAWDALRVLGPMAKPAIPEVTQIALDSRSLEPWVMSICFLRDIGPDGVAALAYVIDNRHDGFLVLALSIAANLRNLGTNGPAMVSALLTRLKDKDEEIAEAAALALGALRLEPNIVVPALIERARGSSHKVRIAISQALGIYGMSGQVRVPYLVHGLQDSNLLVREWATNSLRKIAPETLTNGLKDF